MDKHTLNFNKSIMMIIHNTDILKGFTKLKKKNVGAVCTVVYT